MALRFSPKLLEIKFGIASQGHGACSSFATRIGTDGKGGLPQISSCKRCLPRNFWWGKKPEELSNIFQYRTKCEGQFADCGVFAFREMMNWWSCSPRSGLRRKFLIRLGLQYVISIGGGFVYHYDPLHVDLMMFVDEMFQLDFDVLLPTAISDSSEASYK